MEAQRPGSDGRGFWYSIAALRLGLFDLGGVLYHANYYALLEETREAYLRDRGFPYPRLAEAGQHLAIAESHQQFQAPVRYGQSIHIQLTAEDVRFAALTLHYRIFAAEEPHSLLHTAWTRLVFIDSVAGVLKPGRMPEELREIFLQLT